VLILCSCAEFGQGGHFSSDDSWVDVRENESDSWTPSESEDSTAVGETSDATTSADGISSHSETTEDEEGTSSSTQTSADHTDTDVNLLGLGQLCLEDEECRSNHCLGASNQTIKRCGECSSDQECASTRCHVYPEGGSSCEKADAGNECSRDDDCSDGLVCDDSSPPFTCQPCRTNAQCPSDQFCARRRVDDAIERSCRPMQSAVLGDQCVAQAKGEDEHCCASRICAGVVSEQIEYMVCSQCLDDEDCGPHHICEMTGNVNPDFDWPMRTCVKLPTAY
jgi:hypothetical protein